MSFNKNKEYYDYRIKNIKKAIRATKKDMGAATETRVIEAHAGYLVSCKKELVAVKKELATV